MMDIDPRWLELMHAEIDGLNSASDSARLREYLAGHPQAMEQFRALEEFAETLARVEPVPAPQELRARILATLAQQHAVRGRPPLSQRLWRRLVPEPRLALRYGYVFAAGLVLGVVAYHLATSGPGNAPWNGEELVGTMAHHQPTPGYEIVQTLELDAPGVTGAATLSRRDGACAIEFELDSTRPIEIVLGFNDLDVGVGGLLPRISPPRSLELSKGSVRWEQDGRQGLAVLLTPRQATEIEIEVLESGQAIRRGSLRLPGPA